ncbi:hypothetical protein PPERSA_02839 [Pseudocohnilembus persalinus]|uniref:RGS domain-containing protein n=1 Tax=Pseudocohnilembus persalinus TaxID=266149 RepID=A0A0V0QMK1_PSEPJ|nr:hypothetical protein PPERSA_02839 [Pseudocohnilembus persalinus]|eukprot:KRX03460.1 hypothetical protein PPERSA_02839 [Pseudocohnilembus persalinus]
MTMLIKPSIVNMQKINQANQRNLFETSGIIESDEQENQSQQIYNQNQDKNLDQFPQFKNQKSPQQQNQQDQFLSPNLMKEQIFEFKQKMIESMQFNQSLTKSQEFEQNNQENGNENTLNGFSNYLGQDAKLKFLNVFNQDQQDKKGGDKNKNQKGKKNQEQIQIQDLSLMAEKTMVYIQGIKKNSLLGQYIMDLRKQHQQKKLQQANDQKSENEKSNDLSETFNLPEKLQINLNTPKLRNMTSQINGNKNNLSNVISQQNSPIKQKSQQNDPVLTEYEQMLETCKNFLIFTQNINQEQEQNKYFLEEIKNYDKFENEENEKKKKNKKLLNNYLVEQVRKNIEKTNLFDSGENQESSYLQINKNNNNKNNNNSQNNMQSFSQQENLDSINKSHEKNNSYMKNSQKKSEQLQQQQSFSSSNYSNQYAQQTKNAKKVKQENQEKFFFKNYFGNCDSIQQQYNNIIGKCKILAIIKAEDYFQIKYSFLKQSEQIIGLEKALLFLEGIETVRYNIIKDYYIMAQLEESHEIKGNLSRALTQHLPRLVRYTKEEILDLSTFSYLAKTFFSKYDTFNYEDIQLCIQQQIEKKQIKRWGYIFDIQIKGFQKVLIEQAKLQKSQAQIISQSLWSAVVDQIILA